MAEIHDKDFLKTLARGLALITSFEPQHSAMTVAEVARKNRMSRASARRFLLTLKHLGYVIQVDDRFQLTAKILGLGYLSLASLDFIESITPFMKEVTQKLERSCSAAVLEEGDIVYVARIPYQRNIISVNLQIGSRLPAYATSMGRVLLAELSDEELDRYLAESEFEKLAPHTVTDPEQLKNIILKARRDGYALAEQQLELSLRSLAIPIRNRHGTVLCAINVSMPAETIVAEEAIGSYLPVLRKTAARIEQVLAGHTSAT